MQLIILWTKKHFNIIHMNLAYGMISTIYFENVRHIGFRMILTRIGGNHDVKTLRA